MTRDDLLKMAGRRAIRRRPTFGPADRKVSEPSMAPSHGLTPMIVAPGRKTYVYGMPGRVAVACWDTDLARVPVTWLTWEEFRRWNAVISEIKSV